MNKPLFEDFDEVSEKQWKQKIQMELDGAAYENLLFQSEEGIIVKPFYHQETFDKDWAPPTPSRWNCCERFVLSPETKPETIIKALNQGAESLWLVIPFKEIDSIQLLKNLPLSKTSIYLEFGFLPENLIEKLEHILPKKHKVSLGIDIIGHLTKTGNWYQNMKSDYKKLIKLIKTSLPITITVSTDIYQQAGANKVQQLAYALAHANEYLHFLYQKKPTDTLPKLTFKMAMGSNYFFEIAKLKAMRNLYSTLAAAYGAEEEINILAFPTQRNKTLYDYNVNLLRTTTESMSAILGGANEVCNLSYDEIYHHDNDFGRRIARNQLLILKHESHFDKVANPTDGSYYIAELTRQLSERALDVFKTMEDSGGLLTQLKAGTLQRKIKESAVQEQKRFKEGEKILVGTNKYQNPADKMKQELERKPFLKHHKRKTLIEPIIARRIPKELEQKRLSKEP